MGRVGMATDHQVEKSAHGRREPNDTASAKRSPLAHEASVTLE